MPVRDTVCWNSMIKCCLDCGDLNMAMALFDDMPERNVVSWTTMEMPRRNVISWTSVISGIDQRGRSDEGSFLFRQMVVSGVEPTLSYSFDAFVTASLVTFYANCKHIDNCCKICNANLHVNVVVWTALLTGYGLNRKHEDALKVFGDVIKLGILPNQSSFTSALNSCCELEALDRGKVIHTTAIKLGLETDAFVANSLIE
ncbi:pentatricopeptide repeat (PPR) superfamily protein [Actinidia rufa]|uniref:Pentatricopeptide repeat (PPR) superfamily protein n=1 Tax=Actinidia rufa TaxID=165716 RepID=A0A7J0ESV3_9ERIC|nr:pentatricopeptide repeat (PPR) superfamily protein [Actinidia rufa]